MYNRNLNFHFVGIGGSGMSGLAEILLSQGFKVSGSDVSASVVTERLSKLGARIVIGHSADALPEEASLLVYSSAVPLNNPEVLRARERGLPVVRRAEVLAELMRLKYAVGVAGSHGKTTTTSMTAAVLDAGRLDPTVIIGGVVKSIGSGARVGRGDYLVAETDESDRSFLLLKPTIAIVTNIDREHMVSYESMDELEQAFEQFVDAVPFYGLAVLGIDDPRVAAYAARYSKRKITYGISREAMLRAEDIAVRMDGTAFRVVLNGAVLGEIKLPMLGVHLAVNSLAAIAVGLEFGIPFAAISGALNKFQGVGRRIELIGVRRGVTVYSDYGHHPTEVRATLKALRAAMKGSPGRFHVVFQPHRYSRTRDCFSEFLTAFDECDSLTVTDIYAASEEPIPGITSKSLAAAISAPQVRYIPRNEQAAIELAREVEAGDLVLCLGAGSIGALPEFLLGEIGEGLKAVGA